ncbi:hypothetical protein OAP63_14405 [Vibrio sp.]|nr:hypothetical protein [Vibrio sp.]
MNSELQQAQELHDEATNMLRQSREMHDLTMTNQRNLVFALSNLVPKTMLEHYQFNNVAHCAEEIANDAVAVKSAIDNRDVFDIVHAINVLAMANTDVIHVFVDFAGHINQLSVHANPADTNYYDRTIEPTRLMDEDISLGEDGALEHLLKTESQLTELIITAREQAEANAEVQA